MIPVRPRVAEAGRGWEWWVEGARTFGASPGKWIGIIVLYAVVSVLVSYVPYVGDLGNSLLTPVFIGGMMAGCRALDRGEPLRIAHLFEGFQGAHFVALLVIGAVNVALVLVIKLTLGAGVFGTVALEDLAANPDPMAMLSGSAAAMGVTALLVLIVMLVVATAFAMLNWFAPALVVLRGVAGVAAMKLSFAACLRNWVAFLVYSIIVAAAGVVLTIAFVAAAFFLGAGALMSGSLDGGMTAFIGMFAVMSVVVILLLVIVGPIAVGSVYAGFKDTLDDPDATVTG